MWKMKTLCVNLGSSPQTSHSPRGLRGVSAGIHQQAVTGEQGVEELLVHEGVEGSGAGDRKKRKEKKNKIKENISLHRPTAITASITNCLFTANNTQGKEGGLELC